MKHIRVVRAAPFLVLGFVLFGLTLILSWVVFKIEGPQ